MNTVAKKQTDTGSNLSVAEIKKAVGAIHSASKMSLLGRKTWNILLAHAMLIKTTTMSADLDIFEIPLKSLEEDVGFNSKNTAYLKSTLRELVSTTVEWNILTNQNENEWGVSGALASAVIKGGICQYSFSPQIRRNLLSPDVYEYIDREAQKKITSIYSLALLENASRFKNVGRTPIFDIPTFRRLMGAPEFEFKDLNKKVIKPAVEEINQLDSTISLETLLHKSGRAVQGIQFIVTAKRAITVDLIQPDDDDLSAIDAVDYQVLDAEAVPAVIEPVIDTELANKKILLGQQMDRLGISAKDIARFIQNEDLSRIEYAIAVVEEKVQSGKVKRPAGYFIKTLADENFQVPAQVSAKPQPVSVEKNDDKSNLQSGPSPRAVLLMLESALLSKAKDSNMTINVPVLAEKMTKKYGSDVDVVHNLDHYLQLENIPL